MNYLLIAIGVGGIVIVLYIIGLYNGLVRRRNQIENAISSTDSFFIRRSDLIPNLVAAVKQHMNFEQETLARIVALRELKTTGDPNVEQEGMKELNKLKIEVENYPELQSSIHFKELMRNLNEVEEQIAAGRRYISASITDYNDAIVTFPGNLIATVGGFRKYEWQYTTDNKRANVDVNSLMKQ